MLARSDTGAGQPVALIVTRMAAALAKKEKTRGPSYHSSQASAYAKYASVESEWANPDTHPEKARLRRSRRVARQMPSQASSLRQWWRLRARTITGKR